MSSWLVWVLGVAGAYYLFVPHEVQMSAGLGFGLSHGLHELFGVVLLGLAVYEWRRRK